MFESELAALRASPMFAKAPAKSLQLLAFLASIEQWRAGETLFEAGEHGDCAYVVLTGSAAVMIGPADARRKVATIGVHQVLGEIAVLCDVPRTATVVAETDLSALRLDQELLLQMIRETPDMGLEIMRELARRLHSTTQALAEARRPA